MKGLFRFAGFAYIPNVFSEKFHSSRFERNPDCSVKPSENIGIVVFFTIRIRLIYLFFFGKNERKKISYLLKLLPGSGDQPFDLEGKIQLEYYKLEKTFDGDIALDNADGEYVPQTALGKSKPTPKDYLDEVIKRVNELFGGHFTEADRVLLQVMHDRLVGDETLQSLAKSSNKQVFTESIFPKPFEDAAQDCYIDQTEAFSSLFREQSKYNAFRAALADWLFHEFNKQ